MGLTFNGVTLSKCFPSGAKMLSKCMMPKFRQLLQGLVLLGSVVYSAAYAGAFAISPVRSTLSLGHKIGSLTVTNQGAEPTVIQLEVLAWSQDSEGKDVFTPTKDILATPPVFTFQPNAKQVIRLGLRKPPTASNETTYRLFLQEVPPAPKPNFTGLQMALRMSIPIFVLPKTQVVPVLAWRLRQSTDGQLLLTANNTGTAHIQIANFTLTPTEGAAFPAQQVASYLLPNQKREWLIKNKSLAVGSNVHLSAQTDKDEVQTELVVE